MFEQLSAVENRFEQIAIELTRPEVIGDNEQFTRLIKEHGELAPIVEKYREYTAAQSTVSEAEEILASPDADSELKELAEEELKSAKQTLAAAAEELKLLLLPKDPNDDKSVIVEIRGGAGGEEAALFAASLYRMYGMYVSSMGFRLEPVNANETELGGFREITFLVEGEGA